MTSRRRRLFGRSTSVLLVLFFSIVAIGQGAWELGRYRFFTDAPSPPLQFNLADSGGLGSYGFVSSVGGVAFGAVASPGSAVEGQRIRLRYNASAQDGGRLQVVVGDNTLQAELPDWMLVPIARYAASKFDSCVSLFGPKTTDTQYDIVYHENFQNTLLGLRLLQADMLLFDLGETWQLPKFGGAVILGLSETAPRRLDGSAARRIEGALANASFQSWVMTDQSESIVFEGDRGRLSIGGQPYYYFWTSNAEAVQQRQDALYQRALQAKAASQVAEHNRIVNQINQMVPDVREVATLTANMKGARDALRQFNGPVYDAATNTMRYAAFFRYVRKLDPDGWSQFVEQLRSVAVTPHVVTPTKWAK